jgi:hypothetical protein
LNIDLSFIIVPDVHNHFGMEPMRLACATLFIFLTAAGCGTTDEPSADFGKIQTALLPAGAEISQCVPTPIAPDFCEWVGALDGFYFGNITKIQMEGLPMVSAKMEISACVFGLDAQRRRVIFDSAWTTRKSWAYAGYCFGDDISPGGCGTDADCPFEKPICGGSGTCETS